MREVRALYRKLEPDIAHHVAVQAAVIGSLAATGLPIVCLNAITGLGTTFLGRSIKARAARPALLLLLRALLDRRHSAVLVQNPDDRAEVERLGVAPERIALIPGSGVDTGRMTPSPEPAGPVTVAFAGRLVEDKGIRALIEAHTMLTRMGVGVRLLIAGTPDPANPTSISPDEIAAWARQPNVTYCGFVADIPAFWASAHIAVLPSRREGLPMTLLEAAACGRPLVATDVPGCREIARPGLTRCWCPPTTRRRSPPRSSGWPATASCGRASVPPAARWWSGNFPAPASAATWSISIGACCNRVRPASQSQNDTCGP